MSKIGIYIDGSRVMTVETDMDGRMALDLGGARVEVSPEDVTLRSANGRGVVIRENGIELLDGGA